jgi:hypothetical protein
MSKTSDVTDYTPTPIFSRHPSPDRKKDIKINTNFKSRDIDRIVLLTDRKLSDSKIELLNRYYSVYEITAEDTKKPICKLPRCEFYIFTLVNNVFKPDSSWGQLYYAKSKRWLKINNYTITYYRTMELIRDHSKLRYDYLITDWPDGNIVSKYDLAEQLLYDSIPYHIGCFGIMSACLCSRITCADVCQLICGIGVGY